MQAGGEDDDRRLAARALLELLTEERDACSTTHGEWRSAADAAGQTIDLPQSEIDAGVRCYNCGGLHYNVDCPDELAVSSSFQALVGYLRGSSSLAGASTVLRDLSFAVTTLARAGLDAPETGSGLRGRVLKADLLSVLLPQCCDAPADVDAGGDGEARGLHHLYLSLRRQSC